MEVSKNRARGRKTYSEDERAWYVKEAEKSETVAEAAEKLGLNASMLGRWIRGHERGPGRQGATLSVGAPAAREAPKAGRVRPERAEGIETNLESEIEKREREIEALRNTLEILRRESGQ